MKLNSKFDKSPGVLGNGSLSILKPIYNIKNRIFLLASIFLLCAVGSIQAQTESGTFMLGSDLGSGVITTTSNGLFGLNFGLNDGAGYNLGLSPKVGFFIRDNFLIGAVVNLGFSKSPESNGQSTENTVYGLQALTRYYITPKEVDVDGSLRSNSISNKNRGSPLIYGTVASVLWPVLLW